MKIRQSNDRLISTMGFPILVRWHLYIDSLPRCDVCVYWSAPCPGACVLFVIEADDTRIG